MAWALKAMPVSSPPAPRHSSAPCGCRRVCQARGKRRMIPEHDVWLSWSLLFVASWVVLYAAFPPWRPAMRWGSLLALPFGLSEPLFVGRYWMPPTLFNLAKLTHFDLEMF